MFFGTFAARHNAIITANEWATRPLIFLDTETTGLGQDDQIVEIVIVSADGEMLINSLVRPTIPIPSEATHIHQISNEMVATAPTWRELWGDVSTLLAGKTLAIYNAAFDLRMLASTHRAHQLPAFQFAEANCLCVMELYAKFYGQRGSYGFRWQSLKQAAWQCGIQLPTNLHRAAADAMLARDVFYAMARAT